MCGQNVHRNKTTYVDLEIIITVKESKAPSLSTIGKGAILLIAMLMTVFILQHIVKQQLNKLYVCLFKSININKLMKIFRVKNEPRHNINHELSNFYRSIQDRT